MSSPPSSSNGDAAAALSAAWGLTSTSPPTAASAAWASSFRNPPLTPDGLARKTSPPPAADAQAVAAALAAAAARSPPVQSARPPPTGNWRVKFLQKVGVAEGREEREGEREKGRQRELERDESESVREKASELERLNEGLADESEHLGREPVPPAADDVVVVKQRTTARSSSDIRLGYIKKLEHSRAFIPQLSRPKTAQTVTIFDWDDTLLCTTHLETLQRQHGALPAAVREQLVALESVVLNLLQQAAEVGKVFIITNASEGWVQHSSAMCYPNLQAQLAQVVIISARAGFEDMFPGDSHAWKMHAFLQVQNTLHVEAVTNLLSVGDSHIEMDAVHLLGRSFAHALVKTVKLWERPTPYELQKQLEVVADKLTDIYQSGTTLNIWLERENAQSPPPPQPPPLPPADDVASPAPGPQ